MKLESKGILKECNTELLGTKSESIEKAEDREKFKELCLDLGEPVLPSEIANSEDEGYEVAKKIGYPVLVRPSFVLGGRAMQIIAKEEALPLVKRFYDMGFNIEATVGTADFLKSHGIRTRVRRKISEGSTEILDAIRAGYVSYVINTRAILSGVHYEDGVAIRNCAVENGITTFTSLDTVKVLLDVLEEITMGISTIDG